MNNEQQLNGSPQAISDATSACTNGVVMSGGLSNFTSPPKQTSSYDQDMNMNSDESNLSLTEIMMARWRSSIKFIPSIDKFDIQND